MTETKLVTLISAAIESMRKDIKADLQEFVERAIEAHRRRVWTREKWCCTDMQSFASHTWLMPNPAKAAREQCFGGVTLQILGTTVNYCPFCGVKIG